MIEGAELEIQKQRVELEELRRAVHREDRALRESKRSLEYREREMRFSATRGDGQRYLKTTALISSSLSQNVGEENIPWEQSAFTQEMEEIMRSHTSTRSFIESQQTFLQEIGALRGNQNTGRF